MELCTLHGLTASAHGTAYYMLFLCVFKNTYSKTRFAPVKYLKVAMPMGEESNFRIRQPGFECQLYHCLAESPGYLSL